MPIRAHLALVLALLAVVLWGDAAAQSYPTKAVRYIMPSTGASDLVGRLIAQAMSEVSVYFAQVATALPMIRERRLRALAAGDRPEELAGFLKADIENSADKV